MGGCVTGVAWFRRVSAALQQEPGISYRRWIAALLPDLLRGSFNHEARTEVHARQAEVVWNVVCVGPLLRLVCQGSQCTLCQHPRS